MKHHFRPALFGTALGDAWGFPYQAEPQSDSTPLPDILEISDDTHMTLALATAMNHIDKEELDREQGMEEIATQFLAYRKDPDFQRYPGASNSACLDRLLEHGTKDWQNVSTHSHGSGAILRSSASVFLAPAASSVGWTVLQTTLTHDSGPARASAAVMACAMLAREDVDLLDVASGVAGDPHFDEDTILSDDEKSGIIEDLEHSMITDLAGPDIPLIEMINRVIEIRKVVSPMIGAGDFEELYRDQRKFLKILGHGWGAGSATASALLLAQLYLDHPDQYAPQDFLHVAVNWHGNRNTRAALAGALIGANLPDSVKWEATRTYEFEERYNKAIHSGAWLGFGKAKPQV